MTTSGKFAWTWTIREEVLEEYVQMHLAPWPEIMEEHSKAGIRDYSIFQNGNQFFYCFLCDDVEAAFAYGLRVSLAIDGMRLRAKWSLDPSTSVKPYRFNRCAKFSI